MNRLPALDPNSGMLPPGRYAASLDELYAHLVVATDSETRQALWSEWTQHRVVMEAIAGEITRMWLGGSFVSTKKHPGDVDVVYLLRAQVYDALDREDMVDLDDLTYRQWCVEHGMRVDAHLVRLPEEAPVSQILPSLFTQVTSDSFRDIGLYDEVWQRTRVELHAGGPEELRRGYVEVLL